MARIRLNSLAAGATAGIESLQRSNDRERRQRLEDAILEDRVEDRNRRHRRDALDDASLEARLRSSGFVPEGEALPDAPATLQGPMLDALINATSAGGMGHIPTTGMDDFTTPKRYGESVGGFKFDQMSPAARRARADAEYAERRLRDEEDPRDPSFSERNTREIQQRIDELTARGVPLNEANRQARLEAGGSAPRLEDRLRGGESPVVRDSRRAADRDRMGLTDTRREITALKRELGSYPADTPENRARKERLRQLEQRRDSLQVEFDTHASTANRAALGGTGTVQNSTALQRALVEARQAYEQALKQGMDSTTAQRKYRDLVASLRERYRD